MAVQYVRDFSLQLWDIQNKIRNIVGMCHYVTSVVLLEFRWLLMERTPDCHFVVAIVESKEGDIAVVVDSVDY